MAATTQKAIVLNIASMIDLAIGTPEVGVVDFCMLQTVLHCLAQQLRVDNKNVELRGAAGTLPLGRDVNKSIFITEYAVDTEGKPTSERLTQSALETPTPAIDSILIVERINEAEIPEELQKTEPSRAKITPDKSTMSRKTLTSSPQPSASTERLSLVTISKFNMLESIVEDLKERVYGSIPKNEDILEEVRSQTNLKAITDMWTSLNVSSRLEAAEAGIAKLSSLVEDLISDIGGLQDSIKEQAAMPSPRETVSRPETRATRTETRTTIASTPEPEQHTSPAVSVPAMKQISGEDCAELLLELQQLRADHEELARKFCTAMLELKPDTDVVVPGDIINRLIELERKLKECCDAVNKQGGVVSDQINSFQDQLEYLSKQVASLQESGKDAAQDLPGLMKLFQTVQDMQDELKLVHETGLQLAAEKEDRQARINAIIEQIEVLKTIKLDRDDMTEAMAEKADLRMLARKVSHDQFELACDDLSRGLDHALGKLNLQESLWQQALDDIQREIEMKLDKMELSPVKEFFNNKLKQLQENLKQIASIRREVEAAGTKKQLMKDLNCISCDANVVMPMEGESTIPLAKPLPANMSMKPYLTYELDAIRKAQFSNLPQRNLHDWEQIEKQPKSSQKVRSDTDKHICNRYCGGSHTVTTPAQRVARLGHFVKQWGPDVVPLSSGFMTGDDGRMYKVSAPEGQEPSTGGVTDPSCTPKGDKKGEQPKSPDKRVNLATTECRCLEEGGARNK